MAGNSKRPGATRKPGSKKGPSVGTGGHGRKALEGRGPTPKAEDRVYHVAHKRKQQAERRAEAAGGRRGGKRGPGGRGRADGAEVVAGRNPVLEAMRAALPVEALLIAARIDPDDRITEALELAAGRRCDVLEVSRTELDALVGGTAHQGIALRVPAYDYRDVEDLLDAAERSDRPPLIVALDGVTDPHNLGAVLRSAGAFGVHGLLIPERRSAGVTATAWKVSAGAAARVPVARATNLVRALGDLRKAGCFVAGLAAGGSTPIAELPFAADPLVLVVGSEGKGLSRLVREACDAVVSIPIAASTESLNAAVATGIALYEVARLRTAD